METEEYGLAKVLAPHIEEDELQAVRDLPGVGSLADFSYADSSVRHLELAEERLSGGKLTRVKFRDCKILGANFVDNTWSNVVFENCRLEYATLDSVQASTPTVFVGSRLKEVTFLRTALPGGHMSNCTLVAVEFDGGLYIAFDFRGTDLSTIRGAHHLSGILIDPVQRQEIAEALVSELDLQYPDIEEFR